MRAVHICEPHFGHFGIGISNFDKLSSAWRMRSPFHDRREPQRLSATSAYSTEPWLVMHAFYSYLSPSGTEFRVNLSRYVEFPTYTIGPQLLANPRDPVSLSRLADSGARASEL
jgi:hypothetical protein